MATRLATVRHRQGRLLGRMEGLGFALRAEANLNSLTEEVVKSSEIEGDRLDRARCAPRSHRADDMDIGALAPVDRHIDGVVEMVLDATEKYDAPLTAKRLFRWQAALLPTGYSRMTKITVGAWRKDKTGPMQVVSGSPRPRAYPF